MVDLGLVVGGEAGWGPSGVPLMGVNEPTNRRKNRV